jgi:hypothetical protein
MARKYGFKLNTKPPKRTDDPGREARQDYLRAVEHDEPPADYQSPPEGSVPRGEAQDHQQQPEEPKRRIRLTWANTITPEPVRWAWVHHDQGRMPSGHLVVVGGREGTGKSQFTLWLAAQITHGTLPGELYGKPRRVIVVATEDSWKHTIVPRLIAASADLGMVARADAVSETAYNVTISLPATPQR